MKIIIYPAYFNIRYSRREGRRVPKNLAFEPKIDTIVRAARELGYKVEVEEDKRYPRFWWSDKGRLVIEAEEKKQDVILKIARKIRNV